MSDEERCQGGCGKVGLPLFGVIFPGETEVQLCASCAAEQIRDGRHTGATFDVPNRPDLPLADFEGWVPLSCREGTHQNYKDHCVCGAR